MKRCVDDSILEHKKAILPNYTVPVANGKKWNTAESRKATIGGKEVEWVGFLITDNSIKPLLKHTAAIRTFPTPMGITDMRSFMALLQQVAYYYTISPKVARLRHLLKPTELSRPWEWLKTLHTRDSPAIPVTAPSQSPEPPITPITPQYPFQHIAMDYFSLAGQINRSTGERGVPASSSHFLVSSSTALEFQNL